MADYVHVLASSQGGTGTYNIRLDLDHPDFYRAYRLLEACGGSEDSQAVGIVYRFATIVARNNALHLVRDRVGYTVASPFDGRPWCRGEPASRYLQSSSQ